MQSNYTLKQAVITASAMLAIGAQNSAFALGLGNIDVQSHLGQPLRASIQVQGANAIKNAACFRVVNDSSAENRLSKAQFKLSKSVDDVAILTVTTSQIIQEPIVHLSVMAECDVNMRRDYVLLLNPLLTTEVKNAIVEMPSENDDKANPINLAEASTAYVETTAQQTIAAPVSTKVVSTKKQSLKKQKPAKEMNENIVLTAGYSIDKPADSTTQPADLTQNNSPKTSTARLSISGGESANNDLNSTSLRLDRQLRFTPQTAPQALAADIEVQDEATVMSHRLMHLEKQINTLVLANQKLKAESQVNSQQLEQSHSSRHSFDWLGYLLGGGLLASTYNIADKWRRRRQNQQLENTDLTWLTKQKLTNNHSEDFDTNEDLFEAESDADSRQQLNGDVEKSAESEVASALGTQVLGTQTLDTHFFVEELDSEHNILDHADVFLSHGRTSLAIQLLQNYLLDYPKKSVTIWLFLLDLLAKENMQAVYEQTALECKEYFNIRIAAFTNDQASPKLCLEDFPRLNSGLQDVWGTPAAVVYLDDLIYNSRLETRVGFEKSVLEELLLLKNIADDAVASASVIQLDERKSAIKELKEAQLASKKAEKLEKMHALNMSETLKKQALARAKNKAEDTEATFEFSLIEHR